MRTLLERFRFLRWLVAGGLAEYDVGVEQLPGAVRAHPLMRLARAAAGATSAPVQARQPAPELWVVGDPDAAREAAADRLVYDAASGAFLGPSGAAARPSRVGLARFLVGPEFIAADAMALHARGVRWDRATAAP